MTNCLTWAAYLTWPDGHFRPAPTSTALPSGIVGNFTQWAFHEVHENPNRSSNIGDMTFRSWRSCVVNFDEHCLTTTVHGRPLLDDHCLTTTVHGRPLLDDHCSWTTTVHGRPLFDDHCLTTTIHGRPFAHLTVQSKKTITWSIGVQIEKFKGLKSSSLMGLQFIRRIHFQIPFISDPKTCFKVRLVDPNWDN